MAYFTVRNSLNPHKAITCGITYKQLVNKNNQDGELIWVLEVATDEPHATTSGTIPPYYIHLTSEVDLDLEIEKAIAAISAQVNWDPIEGDTRAPFINSVYPTTYIAKITDSVEVSIIDLHPSEGIDKNSIQMFVNDIEVTDDLVIDGDEYNYIVKWNPPSTVFEQI